MQNRRKRGQRKWQPTPTAAYTLTDKRTCWEQRRYDRRLVLMLVLISSSRSNQQREGGVKPATHHLLTQTKREKVTEKEQEREKESGRESSLHPPKGPPFTCGCIFKGQLPFFSHTGTTFLKDVILALEMCFLTQPTL